MEPSSLPNVPGMVVQKDSWIYRKIDGFKKSNNVKQSTSVHPRYSVPSPHDSSVALVRPSTANLSTHDRDRRLQQLQNTNIGNNHFENEVNNGSTFKSMNEEPTPNRPVTASSYRADSFKEEHTTGNRPMTASSYRADTFTGMNEEHTTGNRPMTASARPSTASSYMPERTGGLKFQQIPAVLTSTRTLPKVPSFVETEKIVTRFYGYFNYNRIFEKDSVLGSASVDPSDPRYLTILFFLEDETCEIIEKKAPNSGINGGVFFARGRTKKINGDFLQLRDLAPGNVINILGRDIHLYDADKFTRDYFRRELKLVLPPVMEGPEAMRVDQSAQQATGLGFRQSGSSMQRTNFGVRSTDYLHKKNENEKNKRFLDYDGRTLRFVCIDVPSIDNNFEFNEDKNEYELTLEVSVKKFILEFFLSDNSIEIRIQKGIKNMNLDNWLLLKKCRLPFNWKDVQRGMPPVLFQASDLRVGEIIDIYSRRFLLIECDTYTKKYYNTTIPQSTMKMIVLVNDFVHDIPQQGDGFLPIGGTEDTLKTVYGQYSNKGGKKNSDLMSSNQLRCKIKILSKNNIDTSRLLQLIFNISDSSIQIYEEIVRNSGISGGNYLKKGVYINSLPSNGDEPRRFKPTDIFLGNVFSINGQEMQIVYMDGSTLKYCEANAKDYPMSDIFKIMYDMMLKL
eukprot:CAMPEP_0119045416 /NCGR_PEP_ID=MMETSP1177-20130426/39552_1 /TAXON_ID=2985 /ORGANISM="Ochromonas sp, Strain CCMP1899" /LENGTH=677 /DNA_ID=CAMNT_0007017137 /DNA_START=91 /DNA_END=2121 /DNA_ORIENTATION=+